VLGDRRVLLLAGRALLLQVMHPVVGAGVTRHSAYAADPVGRLRRTLSFVNAVVYGVPAAAEAQALRAGVGLAPVPLRYRHGPRAAWRAAGWWPSPAEVRVTSDI
jgi:uncharacterized protein (DUF2236 family)